MEKELTRETVDPRYTWDLTRIYASDEAWEEAFADVKAQAEAFAKRNVKPLGLSTDTVEEHVKWIEDVNDTQNTVLDFPIVADPELKVAKLYDMIHPGESTTEPCYDIGP